MFVVRRSSSPGFRPVARASCVIALALAALSARAAGAGAPAAGAEHYVDRSLGFSFAKPRFTHSDEEGASTVAITLAGASQGSLAPSVNVLVQNLEVTLDAYAQQQRAELQAIDWELLEQSHIRIGERPALRTHARGSLQGREVEFLAIATLRDPKRMFVLTCTAASAEFPLYAAEFERVVTSFSLEP
jgi:hypothetical protein